MQRAELLQRPERVFRGGERVHRDDEDADGRRWAQAWDEDALLEGLSSEEREREGEREAVDQHRAGAFVELGRAAREAEREDRRRQDDRERDGAERAVVRLVAELRAE